MLTVVCRRLSREDERAQVPRHFSRRGGPARAQPQERAGAGRAGTVAKGRFPSSLPAVLGKGSRGPGPGARSQPYLRRTPRSPRAAAAAAHMAPRAQRPRRPCSDPAFPVPEHKRSGGRPTRNARPAPLHPAGGARARCRAGDAWRGNGGVGGAVSRRAG